MEKTGRPLASIGLHLARAINPELAAVVGGDVVGKERVFAGNRGRNEFRPVGNTREFSQAFL